MRRTTRGRTAGVPVRAPVVAPGAWPVVALVVVLLGLLGALVAAAGPAELGAPRLAVMDGVDPPGVADLDGPPPREEQPQLQERRGLAGWAVVAAWTLVLSVVALLVARSLRRAEARAEQADGEPPAGGDVGGARAHLLGELRDVSRSAAADLRDLPVERVADVVVRSWERLEDAAARAGSARPPHATPSEFTAELLAVHGAPPEPTARLLALYHRARFSSTPLPPDAGPAAAGAFDTVASALWPTDGHPTAQTGPPAVTGTSA